MRDDVYQFATPHAVRHDRTVWSQPEGVVRPDVVLHRLHRDQQAPAHLTRKARRFGTEQAAAHGRVDAIRADNRVGFNFGTVRESSTSAISIGVHAHASRSQTDAIRRHGSGENVEQICPMDGTGSGAEALLQVPALKSLCENAAATSITYDQIFGLPRNRRTDASRSSERSAFIAFGWSATPAPISFNSGAASKTIGSKPRCRSASAAVRPPMPPPMIAIRAACRMPIPSRPRTVNWARRPLLGC